MDNVAQLEAAESPIVTPQEVGTSSTVELQNYSILDKGSEKWSKEWALAEWVSLTDGLIGKLDGSIPLKNIEVFHDGTTDKMDIDRPDGVIYLDKSARPVAWMVRNLWTQLAQQQDGGQVKKPNTFFLNIDKQDWLKRMGIPEKYLEDSHDQELDYSKINPDHIARIRALFSTVPLNESNVNEAWQHPTHFDGKHIMVVDEVESSGATLGIAKNLLALAFPEAKISGQYWAKPQKVYLNGGAPDNEGRIQYKMEWVPPWYSKENPLGRGVADKDPEWSENAASLGYSVPESSKIGRYVLSTPSHNPKTYEYWKDAKAEQLELEISQMAQDLRNKKVLYKPSPDRNSMSDKSLVKSRIEALNGISFEEWKTKRDAIMPQKN